MISTLKHHIRRILPVHAVEPGHYHPDTKRLVSLSLQRSGQHAVINWLCTQAGSIAHFNFCHFQFMYYCNLITPITGRFILYKNKHRIDSGVQDQKYMRACLARDDHYYRRILYSFEDLDIENTLLQKFMGNTSPLIILIIRDPFNWLASSIRHSQSNIDQLNSKKLILKKYLEQALGIKDYLQHPFVIINYNKWILQAEYRQEICTDLGIPFSDSADLTLSDVQDFGGGSSFDGLSLSGDELRHNVFHRWKDYVSDPFYLGILNDDYLQELSESFFRFKQPF